MATPSTLPFPAPPAKGLGLARRKSDPEVKEKLEEEKGRPEDIERGRGRDSLVVPPVSPQPTSLGHRPLIPSDPVRAPRMVPAEPVPLSGKPLVTFRPVTGPGVVQGPQHPMNKVHPSTESQPSMASMPPPPASPSTPSTPSTPSMPTSDTIPGQSKGQQAQRSRSQPTRKTKAENAEEVAVEWVEVPLKAIPMAIDVQALEHEVSWDGHEVGHLPWMPPRRKANYLFKSLRPQDE